MNKYMYTYMYEMADKPHICVSIPLLYAKFQTLLTEYTPPWDAGDAGEIKLSFEADNPFVCSMKHNISISWFPKFLM